MSTDAHIRVAPEALRVDPVQATELVCPDLDLSVTLTPERPSERRHRQVCFDVTQSVVQWKPLSAETHGHGTDKGRACEGQLTDGAELNSTLVLRAELQEEADQVFDPEKAVKEELQRSAMVKSHISTRAAEGLNIPRSRHLYCALVSVSLSHKQLVSQALQDRPALAPPSTRQTNKFPPQQLEAPESLHFYSPDELLRETALLPGDHIPLHCPRPAPRPAHTTFHLHHLHRLWES